ncbi:hypothetical protein FPZ24_16130 [Sphingomonas panacisoli]|uniref:Lipoprotein n=1 Tax=Sphingomonas panacisoli TaxID=1813879 RepID=A0A5B8LKR5_9SPHN|nr:hypothetical protein [Sphingomonas panacisoli]QDZ08808.1 hypothetical protein FPZ24_16130 [Sphingomonas panacisoli]
MRLRFAVVMLSMLLSGCWWEGPIFYPPDPAAIQPITAGLYEARSGEQGDKPDRGRFVRRPDGSWADEADAKAGYFFVRLGGTTRDLWVVEFIATDGPDAGYGLLERVGDRWTMDPLIDCRGTEQIVRAAGGVVENDAAPGADTSADRSLGNNLVCRFADRASLERALLAYAAAHPRLTGATLKRIGD